MRSGSVKSTCWLYLCTTGIVVVVTILTVFTVVLSVQSHATDFMDFNQLAVWLNVFKNRMCWSFKHQIKKSVHFHCNILLKSASGRVSCVWRVEKKLFIFTSQRHFTLFTQQLGQDIQERALFRKWKEWHKTGSICNFTSCYKHRYECSLCNRILQEKSNNALSWTGYQEYRFAHVLRCYIM